MIKTITISTVIITSGIMTLFLVDERVNPKAQALYELSINTQENDAYYYLMGMHAPEGQSPNELGRSIYKKIKEAEDTIAINQLGPEYPKIEGREDLLIPDEELSCVPNTSCTSKLYLLDDKERRALLQKHRLLLDRYLAFLELKNYQMLSMPYAGELWPEYRYLMNGHRLLLLKVFELSKGDQTEAASTLLNSVIKNLRYQLKETDSLIGKIIFTKALIENLDALSVLIQKHGLLVENQLSLLSDDERSFKKVYAREFAMQYILLKRMARQPQFFSNKGYTHPLAVQALYKPNKTINRVYPQFEYALDFSKLPIEAMPKALALKGESDKEEFELLNIMGSYLGSIGKINLKKYVMRVAKLNAKLMLFNSLHFTDKDSDISRIPNPFYPDTKQAYLNKETGKVCFDSPLSDKESDGHCLLLEPKRILFPTGFCKIK